MKKYQLVNTETGEIIDERDTARRQSQKMDRRMRLRRVQYSGRPRIAHHRVVGDIAFAFTLALVAVVALT
jgi:hypothetical protein